MSISAADPQTFAEYVASRVHELLWARGLRQKDLVPVLGLNEAAVSKKLLGQRGWSLDDLRLVANYLGTSISYLVGETDERDVPHVGFEPTAFCSDSGLLDAHLDLEAPPVLADWRTLNRPTSSTKANYSRAEIAA